MVERGVQPHEIKPDERKAIETERGPRAAAHHPGYAGAFMTQRAAAEVEVYGDKLLEPEAEAFAAEVERKTEQGH
jgi:hypothetical protein